MFQAAFLKRRGRIGTRPRDFCHPARGGVEVRINPRVALIEPDAPVTFFSPTGGSGHDDVLCWVLREIIARCGQLQFVSVAGGCADEMLEKERPFVPPMSEKFRVERHDDNRISHERAEFAELLPARFEEVLRVRLRRLFRPRAIVEFLRIIGAGDAVIF